jgi:hypothetical protein
VLAWQIKSTFARSCTANAAHGLHPQADAFVRGSAPFRILLNDLRLAHAAFIAETPIDNPGDDRRNVEALKRLVGGNPGSGSNFAILTAVASYLS